MTSPLIKSAALLLTGFGIGVLATHFPRATAANDIHFENLTQRPFAVSIDEIKKNFVFGDTFTGHYVKTVVLSDGTQRTIELTPMIHDGMQVVEFKDTGGLTYMGLNGTTTNGKLMVQVTDVDDALARAKSRGWRFNQ